jgi:hypothetical protein
MQHHAGRGWAMVEHAQPPLAAVEVLRIVVRRTPGMPKRKVPKCSERAQCKQL